MARSRWSLAPDDDAAEMYLGAMSRLDDAGYVQYEISNVSKPGLESRHNLKYWSDGEWLGFGCGAHSTRRGVREKNIASTEDYVAAVDGREAGRDRTSRAERRRSASRKRSSPGCVWRRASTSMRCDRAMGWTSGTAMEKTCVRSSTSAC